MVPSVKQNIGLGKGDEDLLLLGGEKTPLTYTWRFDHSWSSYACIFGTIMNVRLEPTCIIMIVTNMNLVTIMIMTSMYLETNMDILDYYQHEYLNNYNWDCASLGGFRQLHQPPATIAILYVFIRLLCWQFAWWVCSSTTHFYCSSGFEGCSVLS